MRRLNSIQARLVIIALFFIFGTSVVMGLGAIAFSVHSIAQVTMGNLQLLASYVAKGAELGVWLNDTRMLKKFARRILEQKEIQRIVITSSSGQVLVDVASGSVKGPSMVVSAPIVSKNLETEGMMFANNPGEATIGQVALTYSLSAMSQVKKALAWRFALFSVGFSLVPLVLYWLLARSIVTPLSALVETARSVSSGRLDVRARGGVLLETKTLAAAFNEMLDSLDRHRKELEKAHSEMARQQVLAEVGRFSMMVAHEVKNPLAIIKGSIEILKKGNADPKQAGNLLRFVEEEVARINKLMEDFLLFARPRKPQLSEVDANEFVLRTAERAGLVSNGKGVTVVEKVERKTCIIECDPGLMERALLNIISNAVEACGGGGCVEVETTSGHGKWTLRVKDRGPGIPRDKADKIFEPFFTTKSKGTGLGLAIAREIIASLGGQIRAYNRTEGGAVFEINFKAKG